MNHHSPRLVIGLAFAGALVLAASAHAGAPLTCFPFQIGDAKSLPWGNGAFDEDRNYDRSQVGADTLAILKTASSTLVRMETLRRASFYVRKDRQAAADLLAKLSWMALDAQASGNATWASAAWFDVGFLAATYSHAGVDIGWKPGVADGIQGWAWLRKSFERGADDPARHFAAALVLSQKRDEAYRMHLHRAVAGAPAGSNLARSIESNPATRSRQPEDARATLGSN